MRYFSLAADEFSKARGYYEKWVSRAQIGDLLNCYAHLMSADFLFSRSAEPTATEWLIELRSMKFVIQGYIETILT